MKKKNPSQRIATEIQNRGLLRGFISLFVRFDQSGMDNHAVCSVIDGSGGTRSHPGSGRVPRGYYDDANGRKPKNKKGK